MGGIKVEKANIYQRILKIQSELENVKKNLTVGQGSRAYKAVSERDVLDAVKELEQKYGVYSYCYDREIIMTQETTSSSGAINYWQRLKCKYRFVNVDEPSEFIETITYADGVDTLDKGSGKAMTYADKYALMKTYKISTGDDPDKDASEEQAKTQKVEVKKATEKQVAMIKELYDEENIGKMLGFYKISKLEDLSIQQASEVISRKKGK